MFKNGLRPEKAARMCFRTGVRLPSPPPKHAKPEPDFRFGFYAFYSVEQPGAEGIVPSAPGCFMSLFIPLLKGQYPAAAPVPLLPHQL